MSLKQSAVRQVSRITARYPWTRTAVGGIYHLVTPSVAVIASGPAKGMKIRTRSARGGYRFGTTESLEQETLAAQLNEGDVFYDLGANVGFFTLIGAKVIGPTGVVYAFEPAPETASELRANIALNSLDQVEVIEAAVSDSEGEGSWVEDGDSQRSRLGERGSRLVRTVTLDSLGLQPPNFIKIDVEGAEGRVINGMRETIAQYHPTILCEMHMEPGPVERAIGRLSRWLPEYTIEPVEVERSWAPHLLATPSRCTPSGRS